MPIGIAKVKNFGLTYVTVFFFSFNVTVLVIRV